MSAPSIGLVLGAGGVVGAAYHAGVITALAESAGWDARRAAVIVGTSAGSGIGATVRAGFPPQDFLARATDQALSSEGAALIAGAPPVVGLPRRGPRRPGIPRPVAPWLLGSMLGWPPRVRPGPALAGLLPAGTVPTAVVGDRIRAIYGERRWPDEPLWICALRLTDGVRVVFGRDEAEVPDIGTACEASSAIPGFFQPVHIGHHRYVDGGAYSPTNADLVAGLALDAVVVVSPMSAVRSALRIPSANSAGRRLAGAVLAREVRAIRASGTPVLTLQPTAADVRVMGVNAMDPARRTAVARQAFESAQRRLADARAADLVALLRG